MNILRRALLGAALLAAPAVHAQPAFPTRAVSIVVPFVPGGSNDIVARFLAQQLSELWGQSVVVENRSGAAGAIGANYVARAQPADGHVLMLTSVTFAMNAAVQGDRLPYDVLRDFAPVALVGGVPLLLAMGPSTPVRTPQALFELARTRELTYASVGPGSVNQFATELMNKAAGIRMRVVQYRGGAQAMNDVLGGHVDFYMGTMTQLLPQVRDGRMVGVVMTGRTRSPAAPEIPTLIEAGLPGVEVNLWWGVLTAARTPPATVATLNAAINRVLATPAAADFLAKEGGTPSPQPVEHFATLLRDEIGRWQTVARDAGIAAE